jgi:hypothetical protein
VGFLYLCYNALVNETQEQTMVVHIEHQSQDQSFAVYIGGDGDIEGEHDRLFSYGDDVTEDEARGLALRYAQALGRKFGGIVEHWRSP